MGYARFSVRIKPNQTNPLAMFSLQQELLKTTRVPLLVPSDLWDERHRRILRLVASFSCRRHLFPTSDNALLPTPQAAPYCGDEVDPTTGESVFANGRAFWDFLAGANHVFDVLQAGGPDAGRRFFYWRYPDYAVERRLHLDFGASHLVLQPDTLLCVRTAEHAIPVLAHLWTDERIRERAKLLQTGVGSQMRTTAYAPFHNDDGTDPAPPPYSLAVLLALAQQQYHYFSQRANPPDSYTVNWRTCLAISEPSRSPHDLLAP
jgi:hypothetical protein